MNYSLNISLQLSLGALSKIAFFLKKCPFSPESLVLASLCAMSIFFYVLTLSNCFDQNYELQSDNHHLVLASIITMDFIFYIKEEPWGEESSPWWVKELREDGNAESPRENQYSWDVY